VPFTLTLQCLGLLAISGYLIAQSGRGGVAPGSVVEQFAVSNVAAGCPVSVGQALSFADDGSVRRGAGTSLFRATAQVYFSETVARHAVTALDEQTLVAAFLADDGTSYAMLAVAEAVSPSGGSAGTGQAPWVWVDMVDLGPVTPDAVVTLSNRTFAVAGGGYVTMGWVTTASDGVTLSILLSPPMPYTDVPSGAASFVQAAARNASHPTWTSPLGASQDRVALTVLSPFLVAISFYTVPPGGSATNASLVTRVGRFDGPTSGGIPFPTVLPSPTPAPSSSPMSPPPAFSPPVVAPAGGGGGVAIGAQQPSWAPSASPSGTPVVRMRGGVSGDARAALAAAIVWPTLIWSAATAYAGAHLTHAMTAFDATTYLLAFPLDDGVTYTTGFPLSVRAAQVASTTAPTRTGFNGVTVTLGDAAVLYDVKAHFLFDTVALSPTQAVAVFVDAALSDGIRAVLINLRPGLGISFGTALAINTGNAGGQALSGAWLHLSVKAMGRTVSQADLAARAAALRTAEGSSGRGTGGQSRLLRDGGGTRVVSSRASSRRLAGGGGYYDDDDAYWDDDTHTVVGADKSGRSFAVVYSDMANYGRVTLVVGQATPSGDLLVTSPAFVMSPNYYPASINAQRGGVSAAGDGNGGTPRQIGDDPVAGYYWVSAAVVSDTKVVVLDTLDTGAGAAQVLAQQQALAARHAPPTPTPTSTGTPSHTGTPTATATPRPLSDSNTTVGGPPPASGGLRQLSAPTPTASAHRRRQADGRSTAGTRAAALTAAWCDTGLAVLKPHPASLAAAEGMRGWAEAVALSDRRHVVACAPHQLRPAVSLISSDAAATGASGAVPSASFSAAPTPQAGVMTLPRYYAAAVANLSTLEVLHNPIGVALTDGGCGATVKVIMQGVYAFSGGAPQTAAPITGGGSRPRSSNSSVGAGGSGGKTSTAATGGGTTVSGGVSSGTASRVESVLGPLLFGATPSPSQANGPFRPGKAYYADTRGRLIEGDYAGAGGAGAHGGNADGGYITTLAAGQSGSSGGGGGGRVRVQLEGDTSVAYASYVGVAISSNQVLIRPGP